MNNLNSSPNLFKVTTPLGWATLPLIVDATGGRWLALGLVSHTLGLSMGGYTLPRTEKPSWGRRRVDGHECLPVDRCPQFFTSIKEGSVPAPARPFLFWARMHAFRAMSDFTIPTPAVPLIAEEEDVPESYPVSAPVVASSELIQIRRSEFGGQEANSVSGRDLHAFLEVGKEFANWIKDQIETFGFVEHQDFEVIAEIGKNPQGGRPTKEYMISISMAKELAMVQRTSKGKEARLYFIDCEKKLVLTYQAPVNPFLNMSEEEWLEYTLLQLREKKEKEAVISKQQQTIGCQAEEIQVLTEVAEETSAQLERLVGAPIGSATLKEAAKHLKVAPERFNNWLREIRWIYRGPLKTPLAFQNVINAGWLTHTIQEYPKGPDYKMVVVTPAGLVKLSEMLEVRPA